MKKIGCLLSICAFVLFTTIQLEAQVITNPEVTKVADGFKFVEGPVWFGDSMFLFSDIPANKVYKWTAAGGSSVYLEPSENSNGLSLDSEGRLILCQHGARQVSRHETDGSYTVLATHYDGKKLNSPNDLTIHSDGSIYFTDPPYGLYATDEKSQMGFNGIYRVSSEGDVILMDSTVGTPNGIALSVDETKLYVTDSEKRLIYVFDVLMDLSLSNRKQFAYQEPFGYTDGMKVDKYGYIYSTGPIGVWIYYPDGKLMDTIEVPGQTTNCAFGGENGDILFVTSGDAVYLIQNK
jgi:gluconolactonase